MSEAIRHPPSAIRIEFTLNGELIVLDIDPADRLLDVLRYRLALTGAKEGCGEGECGSCTVWIDGLPAFSCLVPAYQARGTHVQTVESLDPQTLEPLLTHGATQCGACTPGVAMMASWIRAHPEMLATHTIREMMAGNLCRCTGYDGIVQGVQASMSPAVPVSGNPERGNG